MRKILTLMVVLAGACGSSGGAEMMGGAGTDGSAQADALGADARAGQDAATPGTDVAGSSHDMAPGGADAFVSHDAQAMKTDTAPVYGNCAQGAHGRPCGIPDDTFTMLSGQWKDGYNVAICADASDRQITGCLVPLSSGQVADGNGPLLCVSVCADGCYRASGTPCSRDSDCCSPLRCANGKTCQ